jgi:uncharacterized protein (TIGR02147 family)
VLDIQATQVDDFRFRLQNELERRCQENPNYSLRAFAKFLGVDSSVLSKIVNNKRTITPKMFEKLSSRLGLSPQERIRFVENLSMRSLAAPGRRTSRRTGLTLDQFELVSKWYHFAILELTCLADFKLEPKYIARKLKITVSQVNFAIERLQRLGMLVVDEGGVLKSGNFTTTRNVDTTVALRNLQKAILNQAANAIDDVPPDLRDNSTITVATSWHKIAAAKGMIKRFRRELSDFLSDNTNADAVYQISTHFFPVTELEVQKTQYNEGDTP